MEMRVVCKENRRDQMLSPSKTLKAMSLALILMPLIAATRQGPANGPANPSPTSKQAAASTAQTKTSTPAKSAAPKPDQTHPAGGKPVEVGDPWDSLKLDSKARIKLSFRNANVDNVIAMIQQASHITIVKDPGLVGPVTVATADPVSLSEAFHVFNSVLKLKGFEFTRDRKILIITRLKPPAPPPPPQVQMAPPQPAVDPNAAVVKYYKLQYAAANQVARAINEVFAQGPPQPNQGQPFGMVFNQGGPPRPPGQGPTVKASYEEFSNLVIVNAPAAQQTEVEALIKEIDKRQNEPMRSKTYKLTYAIASDILSSVQNVLQSNMGKGRGAKNEDNNNFGFFFFGFGSQNNQNLAVADSRTNSIIVTGTDDMITVADKVIADLDQKMTYTGTTFVFKLENARADTVANLLTAAFGQRQGAQTSGNTNRPITPTNNTFSNSSSTSGRVSPNALKKNELQSLQVPLQDPNAESGNLETKVGTSQIFGFFGQDGGNGGRNRMGNGQSMGHDQEGRVVGVHDLTGQVTAIADPNTNSVIIVTAPDNVDLIKDVLDQLDKIPEQVMVQTIIVEATLDKAKQFGLEWQFAQNKVLGNKGTTGTASTNFGLQNASPPLQGFDYALTGGDLTAFFNMLQTDTKFQVLATPRVFTSNNMEAQINISQSIPYIVSTLENTNGTTSYNYAFQDVGIVLTITPHITSNGYVTMDVLQTANDLQSFTSFNAPIVNQRQAETTMSAKDGQTIILGGMIRNQVTSTVNKVPLLGDIPFLGNLFKSTSSDHNKTELLVFLTPKVVRDPAEAKKIKDDSQSELSPAMQRILQEQMRKQESKAKSGGSPPP